MTAQPRLPKTQVDSIREALTTNALPGETEGFDRKQQRDAAEFVAAAAAVRPARTTALRLESTGGEVGRRRMRLVIINEDMPFLVDSIAGAIAARDIAIHRLLHPIVRVSRDKDGRLERVGDGEPESIVYIELDRTDARGRQELARLLRRVLTDVRAAVTDWKAMLAEMMADADSLERRDSESSDLLRWLADDNFTLLGHAHVGKDGRL
ncbi:MAG TPA: glutamate dehydrogenase, partial [Sphingomicrobium sp.]|nr:glutamate dehydrogenase [Sphingomicrobium sp.]